MICYITETCSVDRKLSNLPFKSYRLKCDVCDFCDAKDTVEQNNNVNFTTQSLTSVT